MDDPLKSAGQVADGVGKISEFGSKLIDLFRDVAGIDARKIIKDASAQSKAIEMISKATGEAEVRSAAARLIAREIYRNQDIAQIINKTLPLIDSPQLLTQPSLGFVHKFTNAAEDVSEEDLQEMFARLLVQEMKNPNAVSNRSLQMMKNLSSAEAQMINVAASLVCKVGPEYFLVAFNRETRWFFGLTFDQLRHLDRIGILEIGSLAIGVYPTSAWWIDYLGEKNVFINNTESIVQIPVYPITWDGLAIIKAAKPQKNDLYIREVIGFVKQKGLEQTSPEEVAKRMAEYSPK